MPRAEPFPIIWQPYAGPLSRREARAYLDRIWSLTLNPCSGQRLRDPTDPHLGVARWDEFCELALGSLLRVIYRWIPPGAEVAAGRKTIPGPVILVEAFGPHVGRSKPRDVLTRLRQIHDTLPDDHGHAQVAAQRCCEDCGDDGRVSATRDDLLAFLLRVAAR